MYEVKLDGYRALAIKAAIPPCSSRVTDHHCPRRVRRMDQRRKTALSPFRHAALAGSTVIHNGNRGEHHDPRVGLQSQS